jgi:hypothetical protein
MYLHKLMTRKRRMIMPKYMIQASYVGDGLKGLLKEGGTKRREIVVKVQEAAARCVNQR